MTERPDPFEELLRNDRRYRREAYHFVWESLHFAQEVLGMGAERRAEGAAAEEGARPERHLTGQELCEAIRRYALEQFGFMAKTVLNSWGLRSTGDIGEIVFNLVGIERMRKTEEDRREDFDDVFDFDEGLTRSFRIELPET